MLKWTRPTTVTFPTIWTTFEGKMLINGKKMTYWIQDITDEYIEKVVEYMVKEFINDEPLAKYSRFNELKDELNVSKTLWKEATNDKLGLVCLTKDENGKPVISGMNMTTIRTIYDEKLSPQRTSAILQVLLFVKSQIDGFKKFNVTEYLDAMGLYVLPKYRGEGIGLALLKAREPLCRACGLKASLTIFTSIISQKIAERAGFKDLYSIDYDELEKINPNWNFPGIEKHTKTLRFMYILYD